MPAAPSPSFSTAEQRLLDRIQGRVGLAMPAIGYQLALLVVASLIILLPLAYLALVAGAVWLFWWHATAHLGWITSFHGMHGRGGAKVMVIIFCAYAIPLGALALLMLAFLKPLIAPRGEDRSRVELFADDQPLLHAYVAKLCAAMGAPKPSKIVTSCRVNASAGYEPGFLGLIPGPLVLEIGLPLVAGQRLDQLTGVLAHEFGHFAQRSARFINHLVGSILSWFHYAVYGRDAFDQFVAEGSAGEGVMSFVCLLARGLIGLVRLVLTGFLALGVLVTRLLSRQQEFDADRCACRVVGSKAFCSALDELPVLATADGKAHQGVAAAWREKRLADDLPGLIAASLASISPAERTRLKAEDAKIPGSLWATHPPHKDRIAAAGNEAPLIRLDGPASALFRDFSVVCKATTMHFYRNVVGLDIGPQHLLASATVKQTQQVTAARQEKAKARFAPWLGTHEVFQAEGEPAKGDAPAIAASLTAAREKWVKARLAHVLVLARIQFPAKALGLAGDAPEAVASARRTAQGELLRQRAAAGAFAQFRRRQIQALTGDEPARLLKTLDLIATRRDQMDEIDLHQQVMRWLIESGRLNADENCQRLFVGELQGLVEKVAKLVDGLGRHPLPFNPTPGIAEAPAAPASDDLFEDSGASALTLKEYLQPQGLGSNDPGVALNSASHVLDGIDDLQRRCLGRLDELIDARVAEVRKSQPAAKTTSVVRKAPAVG